MIKKFLTVIFIVLLLSVPVNAEQNDLYSEQFELSGADELEDVLPDETKEYMQEFGIDASDYNWVNSLTAESVFAHIWSFIRSGAKTPFLTGGGILAVILISAALGSVTKNEGVMTASLYASSLSTAAVAAAPIFSVITASVNAMKGCATFMSAFVPVFAVIVAAGGMTATSVSMSALLLGAAQGVSYVSNFVVTPLMGGYLAVSITSSVSPIVNQTGIANAIKKVALWIMSLVSTVFVGILGIQTAVNSSADTLSLKTVKFIVGSSVPVAGSALSEALNTVTASMGLLKSSVAIYGVLACLIIFLPLLIELLLWRATLLLTGAVADIFSLNKISGLLKSIDTVMSLLISVILLTGAMFIISLTVVITLGRS